MPFLRKNKGTLFFTLVFIFLFCVLGNIILSGQYREVCLEEKSCHSHYTLAPSTRFEYSANDTEIISALALLGEDFFSQEVEPARTSDFIKDSISKHPVFTEEILGRIDIEGIRSEVDGDETSLKVMFYSTSGQLKKVVLRRLSDDPAERREQGANSLVLEKRGIVINSVGEENGTNEFFGEMPVANTLKAPDHRFLNSLIGTAIVGGNFDRAYACVDEELVYPEGVKVHLLGDIFCRNFQDVFRAVDACKPLKKDMRQHFMNTSDISLRSEDGNPNRTRRNQEEVFERSKRYLANILGHAGVAGGFDWEKDADGRDVKVEYDRKAYVARTMPLELKVFMDRAPGEVQPLREEAAARSGYARWDDMPLDKQLRMHLVMHELAEVELHRKMIARIAGYSEWKNMKDRKKRRRAISRMRRWEITDKTIKNEDLNPDNWKNYNEFARWAHEQTNALYPVSEDEEEDPSKIHLESARFEKMGYQMPIIASEDPSVKPEEAVPDENQVLEKVEEISQLLYASGGLEKEVVAPAAEDQDENMGLILFADDIVDGAAVFDLDQLGELMGQRKALVKKIVLFARDSKKSELIAELIRKRNKDAEIDVLMEGDFNEYADGNYSMSKTRLLPQYCVNQGFFRSSEKILGIIRGPLSSREDEEGLNKEFKDYNVKGRNIPVVIFKSPDRIYSIMQALAKIIEIRADKDPLKRWVDFLPPIKRLSAEIIQKFEMYRTMMKRIGSAA